jgi:hypothetical protein
MFWIEGAFRPFGSLLDHLYPVIEDDDLDYRIGPLEFLNGQAVGGRQAGALTDPAAGGRRIFMDQVAGSHRCRER